MAEVQPCSSPYSLLGSYCSTSVQRAKRGGPFPGKALELSLPPCCLLPLAEHEKCPPAGDSTCTVRGESCRPLHSTKAVPKGRGFGRMIPRPLWCLSLCPWSMDHVSPRAPCWCIFCGQARTCSHWAGVEGQEVLHCSYLQTQQES